MTSVIVLDTGPLGIITNPRQTPDVIACVAWLRSILASGARVVLPEIADYELRRDLLRTGKQNGLRHLDNAAQSLDYVPISTATMRRAAELWAQLRRQGLPNADARAEVEAARAAALVERLEQETLARAFRGGCDRERRGRRLDRERREAARRTRTRRGSVECRIMVPHEGKYSLFLHKGVLMAMTINDDCISCGACLTECPTESITEGDLIYEIDPKTCTECEGHFAAPQCVAVCPVECIVKASEE